MIERSFAHCYETGGLRRCYLRGRENILKRQLIHVGAFNLSLILRKLLGAGTPRELRTRAGRAFWQLLRLLTGLTTTVSPTRLLTPSNRRAARNILSLPPNSSSPTNFRQFRHGLLGVPRRLGNWQN